MVSDVVSPSTTHHTDIIKGSKQKKDLASNELWEAVMREQWRREQQRRRMVRWRKQKKEKVADMVHTRRLLERELQRRVLKARMATDAMTPRSYEEAFQLNTVEIAALTRENLVLQETIAQHTKVESMLEHDIKEFTPPAPPPATIKTKKEDGQTLLQDETGWRVPFPNGEPSFHFHPFTKDDFDSVVNNEDVIHAEHHPCSVNVGNLFGWNVDYAPLTRNFDGTFMAHARFTRRVRCSIDRAEKLLPRLDKSKWPKLVTPRSWGLVQTGDFSCQVLQTFNKNALVMACNIPGEVNLRYIALAQHTQNHGADGKRVDKYILAIGDSEANCLNREAEVDIVYDQWAGCLTEMDGRELYIDWIRVPLEQNSVVQL
ncbi:hypothetical protein PHMEG_00026920 [Phytophthora megakarya]|uniref:Uncharacterized protein n=1 Tax=Phytophthora megakarya TaxID=4795 RepID=A0A225V8M9_9STRA|nr:hypothetical protein PHMEG_00026920 [Phytophthora megakarya]